MTYQLGFPYHIDGRGRTATADDAGHLRDLMAQILFTAPGERVMRPDFGSGLLALTFEPDNPALAATTQLLVHGALQQWLGHLIAVEAVEVTADDGVLQVRVGFVVLRTQERQAVELSAARPAP